MANPELAELGLGFMALGLACLVHATREHRERQRRFQWLYDGRYKNEREVAEAQQRFEKGFTGSCHGNHGGRGFETCK